MAEKAQLFYPCEILFLGKRKINIEFIYDLKGAY